MSYEQAVTDLHDIRAEIDAMGIDEDWGHHYSDNDWEDILIELEATEHLIRQWEAE